MAKNEHTGDSLHSGYSTDKFREGHDRIFGKKTWTHCCVYHPTLGAYQDLELDKTVALCPHCGETQTSENKPKLRSPGMTIAEKHETIVRTPVSAIKGPSGDTLADFLQSNQWWLTELEQVVAAGTDYQKRALAVVKNLLATVVAVIDASE